LIASNQGTLRLAGLPIVVGGEVRFAPPAWARRLAEAGRGLLFLDELSTAPPAVQAALLRGGAGAGGRRPHAARRCGRGGRWPTARSRPPTAGTCPRPWQPALPPGLDDRTAHRWRRTGLAGGPRLWCRRWPEGWQAEEILSRGLVAAFLHVRPGLACAAAVQRGGRGTRLAIAADLGDGGPV